MFARQLVPVAVAALAGAACERKAPAVPELRCFRVKEHADPERGLNPLLAGAYVCYGEANDCEREAGAFPGARCVGSGPPDWHCFTHTSFRGVAIPLNASAMCHPTRAMCEASRTPLLGDAERNDGGILVGDCFPDEVVYCRDEPLVSCWGDEASCLLAKDLAAKILHADTGPCVARRSTR